MKKTLVAVAALAAVTGAMAEVTISGFVDKAVNITTYNNGGTSSTAKGVGANAIGQDQITFSSTEDLGDGMSAYVNISVAPTVTTAALAGDIGQIGLKGSFGNIRIGSDYSTLWYTNNMADASGWGSGAGQVHNVITQGNPTTNVVIYTLPSFVSGLNVTLASRLNGLGTGVGNAFAYLANYSAGGFSVQYAAGTVAVPGAYYISSGLGGQTAVSGGTYESATGDLTGNSTAVTYDFGMAKLHAGYATARNTGDTDQSSNSYTYGVSAPIGGFSVGLAFSQATYNSNANTSGLKESGYRVLAKYPLSKRTSLYLQNGKADQSTGTTRSTATTGFGVTHSF